MARRGGPAGRTESAPQRMTKAERKEQARKERLELLKKQTKQKRRRRIAIIVGAVVVVGGVAVAVVAAVMGGAKSTPKGPVDPRTLPGMLTTQATATSPWPANTADMVDRGNAIHLPAIGSAFHHHDLLQIFVHGETIPVPPDIGLTSSAGAPMHTHDASGIMHLEANTPFDFTLGDFFDVWGVLLTDKCIGGYCSNGPDQLRVYVNGKQVTTDVTKIALTQHEDVVVTYGTTAQLPNPIPKTYSPDISSSCKGSC